MKIGLIMMAQLIWAISLERALYDSFRKAYN